MAYCLDEFPISDVFYEELRDDTLGLVMISISGAALILTLLIFAEECVFFLRNYEDTKIRRDTLIMLSLYPFVSVTSMVNLLVPSGTIVGEFAAAVYVSLVIFTFLRYIFEYFGGEYGFLLQYRGENLILSVPPVCCCRCSFMTRTLTKENLRVIKYIILQVAVIRPIVVFINAILWTDGVLPPGANVNFKSAGGYFTIFYFASTMLALYGISIINKVTETTLKHFRMGVKFYTLQLSVIAVYIQPLLFSVLGLEGIPPCYKSQGSVIRAYMMHYSILIIEMFLISLGARYGYRRVEEDTQFSNTDNQTKPDSSVSGCSQN